MSLGLVLSALSQTLLARLSVYLAMEWVYQNFLHHQLEACVSALETTSSTEVLIVVLMGVESRSVFRIYSFTTLAYQVSMTGVKQPQRGFHPHCLCTQEVIL